MSISKNISPPKWPQRFLHWYCKSDLLEMIEGDIEEEYYQIAEKKGALKAKIYYLRQVFSFLRPFATKRFFKQSITNMGMNGNYIKVALRGFKKDKLNLSLSLIGLIVAFTCAMIIYTVIDYQLNYDKFNTKANRIYKVTYDETLNPNSDRKLATVGPPLGPAIKTYFPEVEDAVRFRDTPDQIVKYKDKQFYEKGILFADPSLFNVFTYPLEKGNASKALTEINSIVITHEMAIKYFGEEDPIGKLMDIEGTTLQVTGVFAPIPSNTHLHFDFIRPFEAFKVPFGYPVTLDTWGWISFHTYVLLRPDANAQELESKLPPFAKTHFDEDRISRFRYRLQPLLDIYFGDVKHDKIASGSYNYIYVLGSVGILILVLAAFNFTNISTAKSLTRAMETGLRKTMGSTERALWFRYLMEPIMLTLFAVIIALAITPYGLGWIGSTLGFEYSWDMSLFQRLLILFLPMALVIGLFSGFYPAFIMSSFQPASVLKGNLKVSHKGNFLRTTLVTVQFGITSALLIGSFIISAQVNFMLDKDLGYDKDQIAILQIPGETLEKYYRPLKQQLLQNPYVQAVSIGGTRMDGDNGSGPILAEGFDEGIPMKITAIGEDFLKTIGVQMLAGKEFSATHEYDSADGIIINESAAKVFKWTPEEAIGKKMQVSDQREGHVMGVVKNFNFSSLHEPIAPFILIYPHTRLTDVYIKLKPGKVHDLVLSIENSYNGVIADVPFDFMFLDDHLQKLYASDKQFASLVKIFSWITMIVAIVGLYGLIALICRYRMKEIGVRKVLGATFSSLIFTLSKSFVLLIIIANVITWPMVYYFASQWINSFAYQVDLSLMYFVLGFLITIGIASIALTVQSGKAALVNPVNTLRQE
ncbi:MAG TPA: ABC transporter permease [Fulvivirga sp.]|nr:ABC transporter permease [Fulvivirga sp.]